MNNNDSPAQKSRNRAVRILHPSQTNNIHYEKTGLPRLQGYPSNQISREPFLCNFNSSFGFCDPGVGSLPPIPPPNIPQPSPRSYKRTRDQYSGRPSSHHTPRSRRFGTVDFSRFGTAEPQHFAASLSTPPSTVTSPGRFKVPSCQSSLTPESPLILSPRSPSELSDNSSMYSPLDFPQPPSELPSISLHLPPSLGIRRIRSSPLLNSGHPYGNTPAQVVAQKTRLSYLCNRKSSIKAPLVFDSQDAEALLHLTDDKATYEYLQERSVSNHDGDNISLMLQSLQTLAPRQSRSRPKAKRVSCTSCEQTTGVQDRHRTVTTRVIKPSVSFSDLRRHQQMPLRPQPTISPSQHPGGFPRMIRKITSMRSSLRQSQHADIRENSDKRPSRTMSHPRSSFALNRFNLSSDTSPLAIPRQPSSRMPGAMKSSTQAHHQPCGNYNCHTPFSSGELKSYLNITPEKGSTNYVNVKSKKNLWVRASQSILGWGRFRTRD